MKGIATPEGAVNGAGAFALLATIWLHVTVVGWLMIACPATGCARTPLTPIKHNSDAVMPSMRLSRFILPPLRTPSELDPIAHYLPGVGVGMIGIARFFLDGGCVFSYSCIC